MEHHRICPKAPDLFPQYSSFKLYPWNKAPLTPRQHFVAHLLLRKVFGGSQSKTLLCMINRLKVSDRHINSNVYETVKNEQSIDNKKRNSGEGHWSKKPGKIHNAKINHPKGFKGKQHRQQSKDNIRNKQLGDLNHFYGKKHKPETLAVITAQRKAKIWITDGFIDKQHIINDPIPLGFQKGRTNGTMLSRMWITNGISDTHIKKGYPIPPGYRRGRTHTTLNQ